MLLENYLNLSLKQLHAAVGLHVRTWVRNPKNQLVRAGNRKTGEQGRYGVMVKTKGLVWHDCPGRSPGCGECQILAFATWRKDLTAYIKSYEAVYSYLAHHDLDTLYDVLVRDLSYHSTFAQPRLIVRIHEAGDFVSANHVGVYQRLAMTFPDIWFFGYSHSTPTPDVANALRGANVLPNFMVRQSLDETRMERVDDIPASFYGDPKNKPVGSFNCPEQYGDHTVKCADCMLCLKTTRDVYFIPQKKRRLIAKVRNKKLRAAGIHVPDVYGSRKKKVKVQ